MRLAPAGLTALLALLLGAPASAAARAPAPAPPSAWDKVWRSEDAAKQVSAAGRARTMAVLDGEEVQAVAHVQAEHGKLRLDYEALHRKWSLIDDGERLVRLDPRRRQALVTPRPGFALDRSLAERNYLARVMESDPVIIAGRTTEIVDIVPRGEGPRVWRLWLDKETGFPLKRERYAVTGRRISGTEYLEIKFEVPAPPDLFEVPKGWQTVGDSERRHDMSLEELSRSVGFDVSLPRNLPSGYVPWGRYVSTEGRGRGTTAELRYTDGLRVLTILQRAPRAAARPSGEGPPPPGRMGRERHGRGPEPGRGSGLGRGRGPGPGRGGRGFGPPTPGSMSVVDRGAQKALRYFGRNRVIIVVGDLTVDQLSWIAKGVG